MANGGAAKLAHSGITSFGDADGFGSASAIFKDHLGDLYVLGAPLPSTPRLFEETRLNKLDGERFTPLHLRFPGKTHWAWGWNQLVLEDHKGEWSCDRNENENARCKQCLLADLGANAFAAVPNEIVASWPAHLGKILLHGPAALIAFQMKGNGPRFPTRGECPSRVWSELTATHSGGVQRRRSGT